MEMNTNSSNGKLPDRGDFPVDTLKEKTEQVQHMMSTYIAI